MNTAIGPDHAKIAIAELKLTLRKYGKGIIGKESTQIQLKTDPLNDFSRILCERTSQNKEISKQFSRLVNYETALSG